MTIDITNELKEAVKEALKEMGLDKLDEELRELRKRVESRVEPEWIDISEAVRIFGVARSTLYKIRRRKDFPKEIYRKIGTGPTSRVVYNKKALDEYLARIGETDEQAG